MRQQIFFVPDKFVAGDQPHILCEIGDAALMQIEFEPFDKPGGLRQHQRCFMGRLVVLRRPGRDHLVEQYRVIGGCRRGLALFGNLTRLLDHISDFGRDLFDNRYGRRGLLLLQDRIGLFLCDKPALRQTGAQTHHE